MTNKTAINRAPKSQESLPPSPKQNGRRVRRDQTAAASADYDDEVTNEQVEQIREAVKQDVEEEELELIDGPGW